MTANDLLMSKRDNRENSLDYRLVPLTSTDQKLLETMIKKERAEFLQRKDYPK